MTALVKPLLFAACAGSLALAGQEPPPPPPPAPPAMPFPVPGGLPTRVTVLNGQEGGGFGGSFSGGFPGNVVMSRSLGDDPKTRELAKKLVDAKDDEAKEKLRGELKAALAKAFDDRLKGQEKQIAELEAQLKRLREMVGKRKDAKADIIADRLTALEKEAKGLGW